MKKIIIAIDGVSSTGKSTMAKDLASELGYIYIDTGAMYRAVTLYALRNGYFSDKGIDLQTLENRINDIHITFHFNEEAGRPDTYLNGENVEKEIRGMEVASKVSQIASIGFVRHYLVAQQQLLGKARGIVMDGRDIGTVVFPDAEMKVYVTASPEIRARRRLKELQEKGETTSFEKVLENVKERDYIDMNRAESPLRQAADALVLDNSEMTIPEQKDWLLTHFRRIISA